MGLSANKWSYPKGLRHIHAEEEGAMGSGRTWQSTWDDGRAGKHAGPNTPPAAETSFTPANNPTLSTSPHELLANTTSLPSFAHAFREASSPPTEQLSRGSFEHVAVRDSLDQPLRTHTPPSQKRAGWQPAHQPVIEHDASSFSSDYFSESALRPSIGRCFASLWRIDFDFTA